MSEPSAPASARVLIVEDHPIYRSGLVGLLTGESWIETVVEAGSLTDALRLVVTEAVDLVAMDIKLPDGNGLEATPQLLRLRPQARVVVLTADEEERTVAAALGSGASGYLLKQSEPDDIVHALHTVWRGGIVLGPRVGAAALEALRAQSGGVPEPFDRLTGKDLEIVSRVVAGMATSRIGRQLGLAEQTVRNRLSPIYRKLGVADRSELTALAASTGLHLPER